MKITRESTGSLVIQRVSAREVCISGETYSQPVALTPSAVLPGWDAKPVADLGERDFDPLLDDGTEIVVLGTGPNHVFPSRELMFAFARRGIGLEVMDTAAAARTYNVLAGEGRRIAAVLYIGA